MEELPQVISFLDVDKKPPSRIIAADTGVSACYEPLTEPGPPRTTLDSQSSPLPQDPATRAWARKLADDEPTVVALAEQFGGRKRARAFMDMAFAHFTLGDLGRGRDFTERALARWDELDEGIMAAECLLRAGRYHMAAADYPQAAAFYERTSKHPALQPAGRYNTAISAAELYLHLQMFDRALPLLQTSVAAARALNADEQVMTSLTALMICLHQLSRLPEAAAAGEEALALCQRTDARWMQDTIRAMLSAVYKDSGQHEKAAALQAHMVERGRAEGAPRTLMIERLVHAGEAHLHAGDFHNAAALLQQALPLIRAEGTQELADVVASNLAFATIKGGDIEKGKALFEDAVRGSAEEVRPLMRMAQGDALKDAGDNRAAAAAYREALATFRQRGDKERIGELVQRLGDSLGGTDRAEALRLYREWLRDHAEGKPQEWVWGMLQRAGVLANALQGGDAAMPYFKRMKAIADSLGDISMQATSLHRQALAHARKGDVHTTRALMTKAHAMLQAAGLHGEAQAMAVELASLRAPSR